MNFLVYWDEKYGYTRISFPSREWSLGAQYNFNVDEFTFEMFMELVDMEEVTKIEMEIYEQLWSQA